MLKKTIQNKSNDSVLFLHIISFIIIIVCFYFMYAWYRENSHNNSINKDLISYINFDNTIISSDNEETIDFSKILEKNSDTVGWIIVNNTDINYSVVKSTDNDFYLNHSFDKSNNSAGWVFADYRNKFDGTDKNIIIYGHNRRNGSMFSSLKNILKEDWYLNESNYIVTLYTPQKTFKYKVFSVYKIVATDSYTKTSFNSDFEYENFLNEIKKNSIYNFNVNLTQNDKILTLSTCADNNQYRIVLHAKQIQD